MPAGRRPKPPELHALAGNPGKRKRAPGLDLEPHSGRVPARLEDGGAREVWHRTIKPLCDLGAVKRPHELAAVLLCESVAAAIDLEDRRRAQLRVARELLAALRTLTATAAEAGLGEDERVAEAYRAVASLARAWSKAERPSAVRTEARQWLTEFGLTPASAAKLVASSSADEEDPLADFLVGR